jgi:putative polyhydroxyalkanoate system protein
VAFVAVVPRGAVAVGYTLNSHDELSMPTIVIHRRHALDPTTARSAAQKVVDDLGKRYQLACAWQGDRLSFERPGLSGSMHLGPNEVRLDVQLSFLMSPLKRSIEHAIHQELDRVFADPA